MVSPKQSQGTLLLEPCSSSSLGLTLSGLCVHVDFLPLGRLQLFLLPQYHAVSRVPVLVCFCFALCSYRFLSSGASPYPAVGLSHATFISQISPITCPLNLPHIGFFTFRSICFITAITPVAAVGSKSFYTTPIVLQSSF